jgi:hypothetical protein
MREEVPSYSSAGGGFSFSLDSNRPLHIGYAFRTDQRTALLWAACLAPWTPELEQM